MPVPLSRIKPLAEKQTVSVEDLVKGGVNYVTCEDPEPRCVFQKLTWRSVSRPNFEGLFGKRILNDEAAAKLAKLVQGLANSPLMEATKGFVMQSNLISKLDQVSDSDFEFDVDGWWPEGHLLSEIRKLVREWYGNLPVEILVINKKLQNSIMEFESLCDRGILDLDILNQRGSSAV